MLDFVSDYTEFVNDLVMRHGYVVVFIGLLLEGVVGLGFIFPGLTILIFAGFLSGIGILDPFVVFGLALTGTIVGDNLSYIVGRLGLVKLSKVRWLAGRVSEIEGRLRGTNRLFLLFFHFPGYIRMIVPALAGAMGFPVRRWLLFDTAAAGMFCAAYVTLGYGIGVTTTTFAEAIEVGDMIQAAFGVLFVVWAAIIVIAMRRSLFRQVGEWLERIWGTSLWSQVASYFNACPATGPIPSSDIRWDQGEMGELLREAGMMLAKEVSYRGEGYPIFRFQSEEDSLGRLLVFAGVHGDERSGLKILHSFAAGIVRGTIPLNRWSICMVGPVNPVGTYFGSRFNEDGCDVNRDFGHFRTASGRFQREEIDRFNPTVIVSLHDGPQRGSFVITNGLVPDLMEEGIRRKIGSAGIELATKLFLLIPLAHHGFYREGSFGRFMKRLLGVRTLGAYGRARGIGVITVETAGRDYERESNVRFGEAVLRAIMAGDAVAPQRRSETVS